MLPADQARTGTASLVDVAAPYVAAAETAIRDAMRRGYRNTAIYCRKDLLTLVEGQLQAAGYQTYSRVPAHFLHGPTIRISW